MPGTVAPGSTAKNMNSIVTEPRFNGRTPLRAIPTIEQATIRPIGIDFESG